MEHDDAIRLMAAEKYFLGELTPELRDSFEEHFFSCQECAADVRAGAVFLEHTKTVLATQPAPQILPSPAPAKPGWLAWLRPALAVPIMAALLAVIGYQNLVTYPTLKGAVAELHAPQILPSASLIGANSRGGSVPSVTIHRGEPFLLFVDIPSDSRYSAYKAELQGPDGKREWSLTIPPAATKETVPVRVPVGLTTPGNYALVVTAATGNGGGEQVARYPFQLVVH
jgi:hypothetical protein